MGLTTKLKAGIEYRLTAAPDLGSAEAKYAGAAAVDLASGTGDNQASKVFSDTRTLAASASEDLDLAGTLTNPLGVAVVFTSIKALFIKAAAGNTNNVVVGGASATQFQGPFGAVEDTIAIPPGGQLLVSAPKAGWAVGAGTADLLKLANSSSGTGVTFEIVICGN
jgi:hypothetical protein